MTDTKTMSALDILEEWLRETTQVTMFLGSDVASRVRCISGYSDDPSIQAECAAWLAEVQDTNETVYAARGQHGVQDRLLDLRSIIRNAVSIEA